MRYYHLFSMAVLIEAINLYICRRVYKSSEKFIEAAYEVIHLSIHKDSLLSFVKK